MLASLKRDFFTTSGRIDRLRYWRLTLKSLLIAALILVCAMFAAGLGRYAFLLLAGVSIAFSLAATATITIRRFHDHSRNGWLGFAAMMAATVGSYAGESSKHMGLELLTGLILLGFFVYLGFVRGAKGANAYGPDTLDPGTL